MNILLLTVKSIKKAKLAKFILFSVILSILAIVLFIVSVSWATHHFSSIQTTWIKNSITTVSALLMGVAGWFMFPSITIIVGAFFQEFIINKIEKTYYQNQQRDNEPKFFSDMKHDIKFAIISIVLNILIIPLYFLGIGFVISILLNSYLLGREFFELTVGYHIGKPNAKKIENKYFFTVYFNGFIFAILSITPIINLFIPILATVWETHTFHRQLYNKIIPTHEAITNEI